MITIHISLIRIYNFFFFKKKAFGQTIHPALVPVSDYKDVFWGNVS